MNGVDPNGNDYVGEATVSGVVVDANEYEYLCNMAENDADAGNKVWAQALLDQYDAATYDPFNPSDVLSSCMTSFITGCNNPVTLPVIEQTVLAVALNGGYGELSPIIAATQLVADTGISVYQQDYPSLVVDASPSTWINIYEVKKLIKN